MKARIFDLRLWFAIGSFGSIVVISVVLALWVSNFLTTSLLERESEVTQEFLESIVSIDGPSIFRDDPAASGQPGPALIDFSRHILSMPGTLRANIYAASRRILWSTEAQIIGKAFENNDELERAFRGIRVTEIGTLSDHAKAEHVALTQAGFFIEAYIPIRTDGGKGPVVGVVEFYKAPAALDATIQRGRYIVWIGAGVAALILYLALFWIVQRGARLIESQQRNLAQMQTFAAIGQMAGAVAHSLRNPMAGVRTSAELWRSELPEDKREIAEEVIREVDRMDGYVRDLLSYCRAEPYHLHALDPLTVIQTILGKHERLLERNRIKVQLLDGRRRQDAVNADEMLLEQALTSLLTNSVEAMPEGGNLSLTLSSMAGGIVRLEITDTGAGIPSELLKRVTESYFTTKARGLGLGLVLAKGIIERFGGKIAITSTPDIGTRVLVDLKGA